MKISIERYHNLRFRVLNNETPNFFFRFQTKTKSTPFPISCWLLPLVILVMLFSLLNIYRKIWHCIKCEMGTNWVLSRLHILHAKIWPITCVVVHRIMWICLWPAMTKRKDLNCIILTTSPMPSHWIMQAKDMVAFLLLVFSIGIGIQVSLTKLKNQIDSRPKFYIFWFFLCRNYSSRSVRHSSEVCFGNTKAIDHQFVELQDFRRRQKWCAPFGWHYSEDSTKLCLSRRKIVFSYVFFCSKLINIKYEYYTISAWVFLFVCASGVFKRCEYFPIIFPHKHVILILENEIKSNAKFGKINKKEKNKFEVVLMR